MRLLTRSLYTLAAMLFVAALLGRFVLPGVADRMFNKRSIDPPYPKDPAGEALHRQLVVADLHNDVLLWGRDITTRASHGHVDLPRLREGNVAIAVFSTVTQTPKGINYESNDSTTDQIGLIARLQLWPRRTWSSRTRRALYQADRLFDAAGRTRDELLLLTRRSQVDTLLARRARGERVVGALLSTEGLHALDGTLDHVDTLYQKGFRLLGLTHFFDNDVAASAHGLSKGGLTPFGRLVIHRMELLHIIVDLAHASPKTVNDVLRMSTRPVIVSHSGVQATCPGPRNLTDEQLKAIAATGGVVGIGFWDGAICAPTADNAAKAIRHAVNVAGIDHVALGSDWDGATTEPFDASGISQVTAALMRERFNAEEIAKIMGGNVVRVLRAALPPG